MSPEGCQTCRFRPNLCHGDHGGLGLAGCIAFDHKACEKHNWTCLCNPLRLWDRQREVEGFENELRVEMPLITTPIPNYIPTLLHSFPCERKLSLDWVALPLYSIFRNQENGIALVAQTAAELREKFSLKANTRIVITGPGPDQPLENFWRFHQKFIQHLVALKLEFVTVPNFSFFLDAPPLHNRYNRSRILRVAERLSKINIPTVLHLNALHEQQWRDWEDLLKKHPEIDFVCLEFQTGYRNPLLGDRAIDRLILMQRNIQRPLHPIIIGGARYAHRLGTDFSFSTIIDCVPSASMRDLISRGRLALGHEMQRTVPFRLGPRGTSTDHLAQDPQASSTDS